MNLTITMYTVFQGVGPMFWGPLADSIGRRPCYILCLLIYIGTCIGLALSPNYWTLFGLRCLQAASISTTIAIGAGVMSDISKRENRATYIGVFTGLSIIGNSFGPLIGGGLVSWLGWRSIFWFLVITSGLVCILVMVLLPETNRAIVGNGFQMPESVLYRSPIAFRKKRFQKSIESEGISKSVQKSVNVRNKMSVSSLFQHWAKCIKLMKEPDLLLALLTNSLHYSTWYMSLTAQSTFLSEFYQFSTWQIGLSYMASGIGAILGSVGSGRVLSYYYNRLMSQRTESQKDSSLYHARLGTSWYPSVILSAFSVVFGWTVEYQVHYMVPLISTFFVSLCGVYYATMTQTLIVDLFPSNSSGSSAIMNLTRCLVCAAFLAAMDRMNKTMGEGWTFTMMAILCFLSLASIVILIRNGPNWRSKRSE